MNWEEKNWWKMAKIIIAAIAAAIVFLGVIPSLLLDYWVFQSLGYPQVFLTNLGTRLWIFLATLVIVLAFFQLAGKGFTRQIVGNGDARAQELRDDMERRRGLSYYEREELRECEKKVKGLEENARMFTSIYNWVTVFVSLLFAYGVSSWLWLDVLEYLHQVPFPVSDPVFNNNLAFYFYTLPVIQKILWSALVLGLLLLTMICVGLVFETELFIKKLPEIPFNWRAIWAGTAVIAAGLAWFNKYSILYGAHQVVYGAGYVQVHVWKFFWPVLAAALVIAAIACLLMKKGDDLLGLFKQPIIVVSVIVVLLVGFAIVGGLTWKLGVEPDQFAKESSYIDYNIFFTRYGFGIDNISEQLYPGTASLDLSVMNSSAVQDIRILDYRAVTDTLKQTQEIRTYYEFPDIDIDRYELNGKKVQVLVVPRELEFKSLSEEAKTWINERYIYTHGYGAVVTPVNQVTKAGRPVMWIQNIPPKSTTELQIKQPRIYYGELTQGYIITNTDQNELDYSLEEGNAFCQYTGTGGIALDSGFKRAIVALNFDLWKILLSDDIQKESRLHVYRNINDRVELICPYLKWDNDNLYFFGEQGSQWMSMGMVHNDQCPYSERSEFKETDYVSVDVNYIRDSVKAVTDTLNGTVTFYVANWDPMIQTYANIYPGVFKDISEMPQEARKHVKYPEELFNLQVEKYNVYHMNTEDFYSKEDKWVMAKETYRGGEQRVEAYNVLLPLSGEESQFVLMQPVTPKNKNVLIGWYGVNQDWPHYGELTLYKFPKGSSILGPLLVEAKINQDTVVSQVMTYWGGQGSRVIKGNLPTLPIGGAVLYVEPLYIESEQTEGAIPELKLIMAYYKDDTSGRETVGLGVTLRDAVRRAIIGEVVSFDTLQREREVMSIEDEVPGEKAAVVGVRIIVYDEQGKEIQKIELLPGQVAQVVPEIK